ncbi:Lipase, GDSL [Cynara cardunculus var. scolymus]|uniref:Lipase, GDSL n=1 Tax=Cynara cardunculus var. scolymus TaxID=59895 RepID=A0A124SGF0_CYNCS|nr:Lipase, GDSL [Cynara cardunculus var. scolymus]
MDRLPMQQLYIHQIQLNTSEPPVLHAASVMVYCSIIATRLFMATFSFYGLCLVLLIFVLGTVCPGAEARAFFVFGDSLVDNGNNNYLVTTARADSPPYGIDYPTHRPTGRFSNGLNMPDLISQRLGAEPTLPYLSPQLTGQRLLVGANFASAGIGILNDTGVQFVNIIRIPLQLEYFRQRVYKTPSSVSSTNHTQHSSSEYFYSQTN